MIHMQILNKIASYFDAPFIPVARWLQASSFITVLERLSYLSVIIAVIAWLTQLPTYWKNSRKTAVSQAWQVINTAQGKPGSGGRDGAIRDLVDANEPLWGLNVSGGAFLPRLSLKRQLLRQSVFDKAIADESDFTGADLESSSFDEAMMRRSDFSLANLKSANVSHGDFTKSNFHHANLDDLKADSTGFEMCDLRDCDFGDAVLTSAQFGDADLSRSRLTAAATAEGADFFQAKLIDVDAEGLIMHDARLDKADVSGANFENADLRFVSLDQVKNWRRIRSIRGANIFGIRNAPTDFRDWAIQNGAFERESNEETKTQRTPATTTTKPN